MTSAAHVAYNNGYRRVMTAKMTIIYNVSYSEGNQQVLLEITRRLIPESAKTLNVTRRGRHYLPQNSQPRLSAIEFESRTLIATRRKCLKVIILH